MDKTDDSIANKSPKKDASGQSNAVVPIKRVIPKQLGMVVINQRPLFPHMIVPLVVEGEMFIKVIKKAVNANPSFIVLVLAKEDFNSDKFSKNDIYDIGVVARIVRVFHISNDHAQILLDVLTRTKIVDIKKSSNMLLADIKTIEEEKSDNVDVIRAYCREILSNLKELVRSNHLVKEELSQFVNQINVDDPHRLADFAATLTTAGRYELQEILDQIKIQPRLEKTLLLIKKELELSRLQAKISSQIEERISKNQRDFFLREQLKEIRKELGLSKDEKTQEIEKLKLRAKKLKWSDSIQKVFDEEIEKLQLLETQSAEFNVTRNYLDWLTVLPWGIYQKENLNITKAKRILNRDHYGLEDVKERILNMIATMILKKEVSGKIICLIGPPGVGKTSVGKSIAKALNRPFYRFSLGGMRDEAEIKGHRRTYIGAMPGKFIQALKVVKKSNAVIMLDEIDKINRSFIGDPSSALLEVLDKEQNTHFLDHYLDAPFDLSKILFIATANQIDTIPEPLKDRMDIIRIAGYINQEKLFIAKKFLVPKLIAQTGIKNNMLKFNDSALREIINGYAREAGVRDLEKKIELICQKVARQIVENDSNEKIIIDKGNIEKFLKKATFKDEEIIGENKPGCVNGLAWTSHGGAILTIESNCMAANKGSFKQTGQLGAVMVESSEIAYSYIMANAKKFGGDEKTFLSKMVHLHVPAGATPKDGPSAGISMALSLISLMTNKAVRPKIGLTGELSLTGDVLPIGGLKEKVIAAQRAKLKEVVVPEQNRSDFDEIPSHIKDKLKFHFVKNFAEVFSICIKID